MREIDYYFENGYIIFRNVISKDKIDNLVNLFDLFKKGNNLFYSQSDHNWRKTKGDIDDFGLLSSSLLNFTDLPWAQRLARSGRDILISKEIFNCINLVLPNYDNFYMRQNMYFDKSTGTVDHIDSWYLDSDPMGSLIACWVALENISGDGGSFHVYPKSHKDESFEWKNMDHNEFLVWSKHLGMKYQRKSIFLNKGDLLFWHPLLLHGSSSQEIEGKSRKSLTAHYMPLALRGSKLGNETLADSNEYKKEVQNNKNKYKRYGNHPIYALKKRIIYSRAALAPLKYYLKLRNSPFLQMNRLRINLEE